MKTQNEKKCSVKHFVDANNCCCYLPISLAYILRKHLGSVCVFAVVQGFNNSNVIMHQSELRRPKQKHHPSVAQVHKSSGCFCCMAWSVGCWNMRNVSLPEHIHMFCTVVNVSETKQCAHALGDMASWLHSCNDASRVFRLAGLASVSNAINCQCTRLQYVVLTNSSGLSIQWY